MGEHVFPQVSDADAVDGTTIIPDQGLSPAFRFLDLPIELRFMVYEDLAADTNEHVVKRVIYTYINDRDRNKYDFRQGRANRHLCSLSRSSKMIRQEMCEQYLYRGVTFYITMQTFGNLYAVNGDHYLAKIIPGATFGVPFTMPGFNFEMVQNLRLTIFIDHDGWCNHTIDILQKLQRRQNLQQLKFTFKRRISWNKQIEAPFWAEWDCFMLAIRSMQLPNRIQYAGGRKLMIRELERNEDERLAALASGDT
ncbi:hypothetical protein KVT40_007834 [Elsinoe batatas]|uniref:Uncharacterized protein n=1 Tax=Elsinoe batatas TaxID=2601811 RepID=A0A8K0PDN6_9PEZI|nr:hypothetical protein KVT40_007834 [Elsinoe batatas]